MSFKSSRGLAVGFQCQSDTFPVVEIRGRIATDTVRFEFRTILAKPIVCAIVEHYAASVGIDGSVFGVVPYLAWVELGKLCRTVGMPCPQSNDEQNSFFMLRLRVS